MSSGQTLGFGERHQQSSFKIFDEFQHSISSSAFWKIINSKAERSSCVMISLIGLNASMVLFCVSIAKSTFNHVCIDKFSWWTSTTLAGRRQTLTSFKWVSTWFSIYRKPLNANFCRIISKSVILGFIRERSKSVSSPQETSAQTRLLDQVVLQPVHLCAYLWICCWLTSF